MALTWYTPEMIRLVQIALLLAIIIPFGVAVRAGVEMLPRDLIMFGAGIPAGVGLSMLLDAWDRRRKARSL